MHSYSNFNQSIHHFLFLHISPNTCKEYLIHFVRILTSRAFLETVLPSVACSAHEMDQAQHSYIQCIGFQSSYKETQCSVRERSAVVYTNKIQRSMKNSNLTLWIQLQCYPFSAEFSDRKTQQTLISMNSSLLFLHVLLCITTLDNPSSSLISRTIDK